MALSVTHFDQLWFMHARSGTYQANSKNFRGSDTLLWAAAYPAPLILLLCIVKASLACFVLSPCSGTSAQLYSPCHCYKSAQKVPTNCFCKCDFSWLTRLSSMEDLVKWNEPAHDKTNNMACAPSEDSDQPGHPPSLIRVFAVRPIDSEGLKLSSCRQLRLWSDWADAQADLTLRWVHMPFCRLKC